MGNVLLILIHTCDPHAYRMDAIQFAIVDVLAMNVNGDHNLELVHISLCQFAD